MEWCGRRRSAPGSWVGGVPAAVAEISGQARVTGTASCSLDPSDPFPGGFTLDDIRQRSRSPPEGVDRERREPKSDFGAASR